MTKTVINHRFRLENSFQYINISTYRPLSGSSYIDLPVQLRSPRKGLTNIKNKDEKCFFMVSC